MIVCANWTGTLAELSLRLTRKNERFFNSSVEAQQALDILPGINPNPFRQPARAHPSARSALAVIIAAVSTLTSLTKPKAEAFIIAS